MRVRIRFLDQDFGDSIVWTPTWTCALDGTHTIHMGYAEGDSTDLHFETKIRGA